MEIKVFYSWQSDTPSKYNRSFIEAAIRKAIKEIEKDPRFVYHEFFLDRDTKGVPGSPSIPATIDKKIDACQLFIADLTVTSRQVLNTRDTLLLMFFPWLRKWINQKLNPNANVTLELGRALKILGEDGVITVMNESYGKTSKESIPFDIEQKRWPIRYSLDRRTESKKGKIFEGFTKELKERIRAVLEERIRNPRWDYVPFSDFDRWKYSYAFETNYQTTAKLKPYIDIIQSSIVEEKAVMRIVGLPGLGKTRLVLESFNQNPDIRTIHDQILYADLNYLTDSFKEKIMRLADSGERKIIILDNCEFSVHHEISALVKSERSRLSFISMDFRLIENPLERTAEYKLIELNQDDFEEVIDRILSEYFPEQKDNDERRLIKDFSKGHTLIATLLAVNKKANPTTWSPIITKENLIDRLIGKDTLNDDDVKLLISVSIFTKLGFYDELAKQAEFIAKNPYITKINDTSETIYLRLRELINAQIKRGIIDREGRYVLYRAKPVGISLAVKWWLKLDKTHVIHVLNSLKDHPELKIALIDQFKYLDFLSDTQKIVKDLSDEYGPFGNAEVLNTEEGSRLFRSLVEVNPEATSEALYRIFGSKSKVELLKVIKGRRNLVWALEKLCFRKETFEKASKVLMAFAVAETEEYITNNSKGQFLQLFQAFLPGTETNFDDRISIIEYALSRGDEDYDDLAIRALQRAIQTGDFSRMRGPDKQGSSTVLQDFRPTYRQLTDYYRYALNKLIEISDKKVDLRKKVYPSIIVSIRGLLRERLSHLIFPVIKRIIDVDSTYWFDIGSNLRQALRFEKGNLDEHETAFIKDLLEKIKPVDFVTKYLFFVKKGYWGFEDESDFSTEKSVKRAIELADQFVKEQLDSNPSLQLLYEGDQQLGLAFGIRIGELLTSIEAKYSFATNSIQTILSLNPEDRNYLVFCGFLRSQNPVDKQNFIKQFISENELKNKAFYVVSMVEPTVEIINILMELIDKGEGSLVNFKQFHFGSSLSKLIPDQIVLLCETLVKKYKKEGAQVALLLVFGFSYSDDEKWQSLKGITRNILLTPKLIEQSDYELYDKFQWSEAILKLLKESRDNELVSFITNEIIEFCKTAHFIYSFDFEFKRILTIFLSDYFDLVWPTLGNALLSDDETQLTYFNLKNILGYHIGSVGDPIGILFRDHLDKIFEWAKSTRGIAGSRLVQMSPIFEYTTDYNIIPEWHPFTKKLIDEFGDDEDFLSDLSANLGTFSWTGSLVPLLEAEHKIVTTLLEHPIKKVRDWARQKVNYLETAIKQQGYFDVEKYSE